MSGYRGWRLGETGGAGEVGVILKGQHEKTSNELFCILSVLVVT